MSKDYVCSLDAETAQKAKDELCEDPEERMSEVETFRKWILEQPHLRCPTGKENLPRRASWLNWVALWWNAKAFD